MNGSLDDNYTNGLEIYTVYSYVSMFYLLHLDLCLLNLNLLQGIGIEMLLSVLTCGLLYRCLSSVLL